MRRTTVPSPGVTTWQTRQDLERTRTRQLIPVILLAILSVLWCVVWLSVETQGDSALTGWLVLEALTLIPLAFGARRVVRVSALIARVDAYSHEDQLAETAALRHTDESIWRVSQLVSSLEDGPAQAEAREALEAAQRAAEVLRPLVHRRTQLEHLVDTSRSKSATATLQSTLLACSKDIERLQMNIADIGASVASLVDAATDAAFARELERLRQSTDDVRALVAAFHDIEALEGTAGPTSTA